MSGHISELTTAGLKPKTLATIEAEAARNHVNLSYEDIYGFFHFLYTGGSIPVTAERMELKYGSGWSDRNAARRISVTCQKLYPILKARCLWPEDVLNHANNRCFHLDEAMQDKVIGVMDTVPLRTQHCRSRGDEDFSGKYCEYVWKLFTVTSLTGFTIFVGPALYSGRSGDSVIYDHSGVHTHLQSTGRAVFGDGGFVNNDNVIIPHPRNVIWPQKVPHDEKKYDTYVEEGENKLRFNAIVSYYRARAEHPYSRNWFGRFRAFLVWTHSPALCYMSAICALGALNIELWLDHDWAGKYKIPENLQHALLGSRMMQRERYPQPPRPELRKRFQSKRSRESEPKVQLTLAQSVQRMERTWPAEQPAVLLFVDQIDEEDKNDE